MKLIKKHPIRKVILSGGIIYLNGTEKEYEEIKKKLTFNNPAYASAHKYTRYNSVAVAPYLTYYTTGTLSKEPYIKIPIGFDLGSCLEESEYNLTDNRVYDRIKTSPFVLKLRDNQKEAVENYIESNKSPLLKGIIQMPTGKGKSILGLYLASYYSCKTLIVVHKDDLVTGWKKDIALAFNNKVTSGLIKAKSREVGKFLTIATVQTLNKLSPRELDKLYNEFGLVIQDEMHHCPASSYGITSNFNSRYKLGLTATPERSDGLSQVMTLYYGDMCYKYEYDENDEDILPVKVIIKKSSIYFDPLCIKSTISGRDNYKIIDLYYPESEVLQGEQIRLSAIPYTNRPKVPFQVIEDFVVRNEDYKDMVCNDIINEFHKGNSCVAFFTQKEHVRLYSDMLTSVLGEYNVSLYYGDNKDNDEVLDLAEKKQQHIVLTTYAKATEGTNVKNWGVAFLVSSMNNEKNVEQAIGRIRRVKEGKINPALVYDYRVPYVYSLASHGATRDSRYKELKFSYDSKPKKGMFSRGF